MRHDQTYRGLEEVDLFFEKNSPCVVSLRVRHRIGDIHRSDAVREFFKTKTAAETRHIHRFGGRRNYGKHL